MHKNMNWYRSKWIIGLSIFVTTLGVSYEVSQYFRQANRSERISRDKYNPDIINKEFPAIKLIDFQENALNDDVLKQGKVILVLLSSECDVCLKESEHLKEIIDKYKNLDFYGVLLFWSNKNIGEVRDKFSLKLFLDRESTLREALEVKAVPMRMYLENGVIRKVWTGGLVNPRTKAIFINDLEEIAN